MVEKDFQRKFSKWIKYQHFSTTAFELKLTKGGRLPFSAVQDHQVRNLLSAKHGKLSYKIPDAGYDLKPFDCFVIQGAQSYVVVMFYERGEKEFYMIDIDDFVLWRDTAQKHTKLRSLTRDHAKLFAKHICTLA